MSKSAESGVTYVNIEPLVLSPHGRLVRARRSSDGARVVLKQRTSGDTSAQRLSLQRELNALQRLNSPLVVKAWELCDIEGRPSLVCDEVAGVDLGRATRPLALGDLLHLGREVARALSHLHERGVVHNDIKPSNVIYNGGTGAVTIVDFDVATVGTSTESETTGEGSLPYLPPERTGRMNRLPDYRADFYSLGVTLFQLASGQLPFEAADALGWAHVHLSKTAPLLHTVNSAIPAPLAELVAKLLAKNPEHRYQSAFGLLADLNHCADAWEKTQTIAPFALGEADISQTFKVSRDLVGRGDELLACKRLLTRITDGPSSLLLVSGAAGVGKTSLVRQFLSSAEKSSVATVYAAFEQHNQGRPYSALVTALEGLVSQALAQSEEALVRLRQRLGEALGANTSVLAEFAPKVERLLGPQPAAPLVNPTEAKHRLHAVIRHFLRAVAQQGRPLVLALDDCQWLDASTVEVMKDVLLSGEVPQLLVVLSYRDELGPSHPLLDLAHASLSEQVVTLNLPPLDEGAVGELLVGSFRATAEAVDELASIVHEKTDGNPFFINELLEALSADRVLTLDGAIGKWRWDLERARALQVSANVAAVVAQRLDKLGPAARSALGAAACIGLQFDLASVARVSGLPVAESGAALWQAAAERLVAPIAEAREDDGVWFAFPHTRVLDAAYACLAPDTRAELHARIGSELLERWKNGSHADQLFDVLHHLNLVGPAPSSPEQLTELIRLNLDAAARARRTAAFDVARGYAEHAAQAATRCNLEPALAFDVQYCRAESAYLTGDFAAASTLSDGCFGFSYTPLHRAQVHALKARVADHQAQLLTAIGEIRAGLKVLGVTLPETHADIDQAIGPGLGKMIAHLARLQVEDLANLPTAQSPETALILELLMRVVPPSIQTYPPLFIVAELMMFDIEMEHGVTAVSCKNFVDCGILQASILGNHDTAYRLGQVAFKLLERFKPTPLEAAVNFVFAGFVSHWKSHFDEGERSYAKVKRIGVELGDLQHVAYTYAHHTQRSLSVGRPLDDCERELVEAVAFLTRGHHSGPLVGTAVAERALARLRAKDGEDDAVRRGDEEATAVVVGSKNAQWGYSYGHGQTMVSFFLRDFSAARHWQQFTRPFSLASASLFSVPDYHLFDALVELWSVDQDPTRRDEVIAATAAIQDKLEVWSKAAPDNFGHKYELLRAERARVSGEPLHVILDGYQRAVAATGSDFAHFKALISELEAEMWLSRGDARHARPALEEAYRLYGNWGATTKLWRLERQHPWLKASLGRERAGTPTGFATTTTTSSDLDAGSILKATQAISKEVETQKLFAALMATLIESAGAQRGCLVLESDVDHQLYVEARADINTDREFGSPEMLDTAPNVCASAVRYVLRTRETLGLDDATSDGPFQTDSYITAHLVRSLLCVPIQRQGQILGVLYLENNQTTHAFTRERVGILQVIASQAAISIYNAQLYSSLERRVKERTAELAQKNRQIATMLDNMDQGVFTIDSHLVVQSGYSRHLERVLGTTDIVGRHCMQLLFQGSDVRPDALQAADGALQFGFGVELWLAAANTGHLIREFSRDTPSGEQQFLEVDWNFICDDQDIVEKALVVVRDVTVMRKLQQAAIERGQETDIVTQVLETGVDAFREFSHTAQDFLTQNTAALANCSSMSSEELSRSFRNLHTLKGNARLLGYTLLVDAIHSAEERYDVLRKHPGEVVESEPLRTGIAAVQNRLEHYQRVCDNKLAKVTHAEDRRLAQALRDISRIVRDANTTANNNAMADVARALLRVDGAQLSDLVLETSRLVPSLAQELHKPTPMVECTGGTLVLSKTWSSAVRDILVQCFRNALFHGIEPEGVRTAAGKSAAGTITIESRREHERYEVRIRDDGRGLALAALRQSPLRSNWNDEQLSECIFESGISTAQEVGLVAGRGVGLDIVRALLRNGGGDVTVRFTGPERAGYRPFDFVLTLPEKAVIGDSSHHNPSYRPVAAE